MSLIQGFAVQKWIRDRGWTKEAAAVTSNKGSDDRRDDLQLIFNHLDTRRRGEISLGAIRAALSMVKLSEDPVRHAHLSESIVSSFCAPDRPKSAGGAVDFTHFADVMACQEQGRKFQTLQDELRSEGLAAAKTHFANIFRKEVVVRGLLDNGGAAGFMCSVFQMLFRPGGLAASSSDRTRKLRLMEEAVEDRKARRVERKRAAQATQKLAESRRRPAQVPSSLEIAAQSPTAREDDVPSMTGVLQEDAETPHSKRDPDQKPPATERCLRERKGQRALLQQNPNISRATVNVHLRKEAIRQASAVLGVHYVPPSPPKTTSPATRIENALRGRAWWRGISRSGSITSGGTAFTKNDHSRNKIVATATPGGFVRCPPASVRRLRLRPQRPSPAVGRPRGKRGSPAFRIVASDPDDPENKGIKAFGVTCRRNDAIMKRTPLWGSSASARLPSWASSGNSACDPGNELNVEAGESAVPEQAPTRDSPVCRATTAGGAEQEAPVGYDWGFSPPKTTSLAVSTLSSHPATVITVVPTATQVEHREPSKPGTGHSRISSNSSLETVLGTARQHAERGGAAGKSAAEKSGHLELGEGKAHRSPRRPNNPTGTARSGRRPHGIVSVRGGGNAGAATAEKWRRLYPNPCRTPLLVRCMRRPEPRGAQRCES